MTDPRMVLDEIAQRAECTQHLGVWTHHDAIQCTAFTHQEAPKLVAALRAVLDLHAPDSVGDCKDCSVDEHWTTYPCPTVTAITEALSGEQ